MAVRYTRERLAEAVAATHGWASLIRYLGLKESGGQRRVLQEKVAELGLDTSHFGRRSVWRKYPDEAIAAAVASSGTLREVVCKLGITPAPGAMTHIGRRIESAGIDIRHFKGVGRRPVDLPCTFDELAAAVRSSGSMRDLVQELGVPDDRRTRAALGRVLKEQGIDTGHFRHARIAVPDEALRAAVPKATGYAEVMRLLGLTVNATNHRRLRRTVARLGLDTSHFARRPWASARPAAPRRVAPDVLRVAAAGSARVTRDRLHRALQEIGVPYRCVSCGNRGEWLGRPVTLQIDHISGDWLDNRAANLRYLCPNCHALTDTWCRGRGRNRRSPEAPGPRLNLGVL
ncbi:HNH endonuclease signature motif containing protein [Streptomyces sp. AM8-1-1]|uniref:HNH endonuclease signature motif containing protein n=1 Tax=Streptomyces sp. AM8-1-1 TaxID=3075825 RepID=UPI0028C4C513|nr:HNH endonuclease signature motif containing protein [Streptomyces sp. AM8-1-1]WNO74362.1 HNH endonuclease signature motif containing protein [Streptomyces sp. AM8-1-1]